MEPFWLHFFFSEDMAVFAKMISLQHSVGHFEPLSDIFPVDNWQISVVILVLLVKQFMHIETCWTKCPARSEHSAGHRQKSAGYIS